MLCGRFRSSIGQLSCLRCDMRIFPRYYARRLYRVSKLDNLIELLQPWIDEVLYYDSPFLRQVASYLLRRHGGSYAPRIFKRVISGEILRLNTLEDLRGVVNLAIVEAFRKHDPHGGTDLPNWLSWYVPYEVSKLVTWRVFKPLEPFSEAVFSIELAEFENFDSSVSEIAIISSDLGLDRQKKYYYLNKMEKDRS